MSKIRPNVGRGSLAFGIVLALMVTSAWGYWSPGAGSRGRGSSFAAIVTQASTPSATASISSVTVSWAATKVTADHPVTGYIVQRFAATSLVVQTVLSHCDATVSGTSCTENDVPDGQWRYSVTPLIGTYWTGPPSAKSNIVTTDGTAPVNNISALAGPGNSYKSGNTVFYQGASAGSFTLSNALSDPGSGPASSSTAALGATATGWAHVPSTVFLPIAGPYVSNPFSWISGTTGSATEVMTGTDQSGNSAATTLSLVNDSTAPVGGAVDYAAGYQPFRSVDVTFSAGTDAGSGVGTHQLQRSFAAIVGGDCGSFSDFTNIGVDATTSPFTDYAVANQFCYRYRYVTTDQVGNQSIATSPNMAEVNTSADGPPLGTAATYSVLGATGVTSSGATVVSGNLGVSPSTAVVGFPPGIVGGSVHAGDAAAAGAQLSLVAAYNDAASRTPTDSISGDLGGLTFRPGVHQATAAVTLTGMVTLDGRGDKNSVFIFQLGAALATAAASHVTLINGASPDHVFWQVVGAVAAGPSSVFVGTIMAEGAITVGANAQLFGRALGFSTVTLAADNIRFSAAASPIVTIDGGQSVVTYDLSPTISGTTDALAGQSVKVTVGGQSLLTTVQSDGSWSVTTAPLATGSYVVVAIVRNVAGDGGSARQNITVNQQVLGAAASFSVLGGTAVSNSGATVVSGDVGVSPGNSAVGFSAGSVSGTIHAGDAAAAAAQSKLVTDYTTISTLDADDGFAGELSGLTFGTGVHQGTGAVSLTGTVTLDARGDPNAYFVFQLPAAFATAAASRVVLTNGAQAANVFWQVNGAVDIGASSFFAGTIMASGAITVGANTQLIGRVLGFGTVTLAADSIRFGAAASPIVKINGGLAVDTYDANPTISGTTDAGTGRPVAVTIGGQSLSTTVGRDGSWSVTAAALTTGNYTAVATVRNAAGDAGSARQNITVGEQLLGALAPFSVLGGAAVSSSGATVVSGDLGTSSATPVVGFPPGTVGGTIHVGDASATAAQSKLVTDYTTISQQPADDSFAGDLGGLTIGAGVHQGTGAVSLTGTVTLDAHGDPNAYFLFQLSSALATAAGSQVVLINGAQAANVFWQVNGAVGMGASSVFAGTIMASGAITLGANMQLTGRALGFGTVTMSAATVRFSSALPPTVTINGGASATTTSPTPTITGTSTAGVGTVTVRVSGQTLTGILQSDTSWSVTAAALTGGPHDVVASVRDAAGNAGGATQSLTVEINPDPIALGALGTYSVFADSGVSSSGATVLSGDLGAAASNTIAGFPPGTFGGSMHAGDAFSASAASALTTAYNDAAVRIPTDSISGEIGGLTFRGGVHHAAAAISLTGNLTLDGGGDPNAVFIFQVNAAMATAAASHVTLINGAQASHVFWQVSGAFGTGASADFTGTVMAAGAITLGASSTLTGRALSYGLITLSTNTVTIS